jgi:exportin-7
MSRPLLGLILLNEQYFEQWRNNLVDSSINCLSIIKSQSQMNANGVNLNGSPISPKDSIDNCLKNLMNGIERNLSLKNRDKFTQNIATFRRDLNDCLKTSIASSSNNGQNNSQYIDYMQHQMIQNNQRPLIQNIITTNLLTASSA